VWYHHPVDVPVASTSNPGAELELEVVVGFENPLYKTQ
jgi:hypothetical protein